MSKKEIISFIESHVPNFTNFVEFKCISKKDFYEDRAHYDFNLKKLIIPYIYGNEMFMFHEISHLLNTDVKNLTKLNYGIRTKKKYNQKEIRHELIVNQNQIELTNLFKPLTAKEKRWFIWANLETIKSDFDYKTSDRGLKRVANNPLPKNTLVIKKLTKVIKHLEQFSLKHNKKVKVIKPRVKKF